MNNIMQINFLTCLLLRKDCHMTYISNISQMEYIESLECGIRSISATYS